MATKVESKLWSESSVKRDPNDHGQYSLFLKEARSILTRVRSQYLKFQITFTPEDRSLEKALWMLHLDCISMLRDCVDLLKQDRIRIPARLFRDIVESLDQARAIRLKPEKLLSKWYGGKVVEHSEYRVIEAEVHADFMASFINKTFPKELIEKNREREKTDKLKSLSLLYRIPSAYTHHTYPTMLELYTLGKDNKLVFDEEEQGILTPYEITASYTAYLAHLTNKLLKELEVSPLIDDEFRKEFFPVQN